MTTPLIRIEALTKRFQTGGGMFAQRPRRMIEAGAWEVKPRPAASSAFKIGERVFHQKFGYGRVLAIDDNRLDIAFEKAGEKRLLDTLNAWLVEGEKNGRNLAVYNTWFGPQSQSPLPRLLKVGDAG